MLEMNMHCDPVRHRYPGRASHVINPAGYGRERRGQQELCAAGVTSAHTGISV